MLDLNDVHYNGGSKKLAEEFNEVFGELENDFRLACQLGTKYQKQQYDTVRTFCINFNIPPHLAKSLFEITLDGAIYKMLCEGWEYV